MSQTCEWRWALPLRAWLLLRRFPCTELITLCWIDRNAVVADAIERARPYAFAACDGALGKGIGFVVALLTFWHATFPLCAGECAANRTVIHAQNRSI